MAGTILTLLGLFSNLMQNVRRTSVDLNLFPSVGSFVGFTVYPGVSRFPNTVSFSFTAKIPHSRNNQCIFLPVDKKWV